MAGTTVHDATSTWRRLLVLVTTVATALAVAVPPAVADDHGASALVCSEGPFEAIWTFTGASATAPNDWHDPDNWTVQPGGSPDVEQPELPAPQDFAFPCLFPDSTEATLGPTWPHVVIPQSELVDLSAADVAGIGAITVEGILRVGAGRQLELDRYDGAAPAQVTVAGTGNVQLLGSGTRDTGGRLAADTVSVGGSFAIGAGSRLDLVAPGPGRPEVGLLDGTGTVFLYDRDTTIDRPGPGQLLVDAGLTLDVRPNTATFGVASIGGYALGFGEDDIDRSIVVRADVQVRARSLLYVGRRQLTSLFPTADMIDLTGGISLVDDGLLFVNGQTVRNDGLIEMGLPDAGVSFQSSGSDGPSNATFINGPSGVVRGPGTVNLLNRWTNEGFLQAGRALSAGGVFTAADYASIDRVGTGLIKLRGRLENELLVDLDALTQLDGGTIAGGTVAVPDGVVPNWSFAAFTLEDARVEGVLPVPSGRVLVVDGDLGLGGNVPGTLDVVGRLRFTGESTVPQTVSGTGTVELTGVVDRLRLPSRVVFDDGVLVRAVGTAAKLEDEFQAGFSDDRWEVSDLEVPAGTKLVVGNLASLLLDRAEVAGTLEVVAGTTEVRTSGELVVRDGGEVVQGRANLNHEVRVVNFGTTTLEPGSTWTVRAGDGTSQRPKLLNMLGGTWTVAPGAVVERLDPALTPVGHATLDNIGVLQLGGTVDLDVRSNNTLRVGPAGSTAEEGLGTGTIGGSLQLGPFSGDSASQSVLEVDLTADGADLLEVAGNTAYSGTIAVRGPAAGLPSDADEVVLTTTLGNGDFDAVAPAVDELDVVVEINRVRVVTSTVEPPPPPPATTDLAVGAITARPAEEVLSGEPLEIDVEVLVDPTGEPAEDVELVLELVPEEVNLFDVGVDLCGTAQDAGFAQAATVTCQLGTLTDATTVTLFVLPEVFESFTTTTPDGFGRVTLTATVSTTTPDRSEADDSGDVQVVVREPLADLAASIQRGSGGLATAPIQEFLGEVATFRLGANNLGPDVATSTVVTTTWDHTAWEPGWQDVPDGCTYAAGGAQPLAGTLPSSLTCEVGDVERDRRVATTVSLVPLPSPAQGYALRTSVAADQRDTNEANDDTTLVPTPVQRTADLAVLSAELVSGDADGDGIVAPGTELTYRVRVANQGPHDELDGRVLLALPGVAEPWFDVVDAGGCVPSTVATAPGVNVQGLACDLGALVAPLDGTLLPEQVEVTLAPTRAEEPFTLTAIVVGDALDPDPSDDRLAAPTLQVQQGRADLAVAASTVSGDPDGDGRVLAGDRTGVRALVTNAGPEVAPAAVLRLVPDAAGAPVVDLPVTSASCSVDVDGGGPVVTCPLGSVSADVLTTLVRDVGITWGLPGEHAVAVEVTDDATRDLTPADAVTTVAVTVVDPAADPDGDGLANEVDPDDLVPGTVFWDGDRGGSTEGELLVGAGAEVVDLLGSGGVQVRAGSTPVELTACGIGAVQRLSPGARVKLTCGSVLAEVDQGTWTASSGGPDLVVVAPASVRLDQPDGPDGPVTVEVLTVGAGGSVELGGVALPAGTTHTDLGTAPEDPDEPGGPSDPTDPTDPAVLAARAALDAALADLDADVWRNRGARRAADAAIGVLDKALARGDLALARTHVVRLADRLDGCGEQPAGDDWVRDCDAQRHLRGPLQDLLVALEGPLVPGGQATVPGRSERSSARSGARRAARSRLPVRPSLP